MILVHLVTIVITWWHDDDDDDQEEDDNDNQQVINSSPVSQTGLRQQRQLTMNYALTPFKNPGGGGSNLDLNSKKISIEKAMKKFSWNWSIQNTDTLYISWVEEKGQHTPGPSPSTPFTSFLSFWTAKGKWKWGQRCIAYFLVTNITLIYHCWTTTSC